MLGGGGRQTLITLGVPRRASGKDAVGVRVTDTLLSVRETCCWFLLLTPDRFGDSSFRQDADGNSVHRLPTEAVCGFWEPCSWIY